MTFSWTSPALPHLTSPTSNFPITEIQGAWIASVLGFGIIFGFIINPIFINKFGSKRTLLILAAPQILSWTIIYFGRNWLLLCVARIIGGFGYGAGLCSTAIYLSEIGDKNNRGAFLSLVKLSISTGVFVVVALGAFLSYDAMNLILIIIPFVFVVAFLPMPDKKEIPADDFNDGILEKLAQNDIDGAEELRIYNRDKEDQNDFRKDKIGSKRCLSSFPGSANSMQEHPDLHHPNVLDEDADDLKQHPNYLTESSGGLIHYLNVLGEDTNNFIEHTNCFTQKGNNPAKNTNRPKSITIPFENGPKKNVQKCKEEKLEETVENEINDNLKKETIEEEFSKLLQRGSPSRSERESPKNIWWRLFMLKNNRKALMIIIVVGLTDIFSGHMLLTAYTQQIFEFSNASLKPEYAVLILSVLKIGASLISTLVIDKCGRRNLYLSTGVLAGLSEGSVALFYFLKFYLKMDISLITWLPLLGLAMYEVIGSLGQFCLYFVYQGELLSDDVKGLGITLTNIFYEFLTFFVKLYFQSVIGIIGIYSVFCGFGIICIFGSCTVYWISPETRGKSKEEIKKLLM